MRKQIHIFMAVLSCISIIPVLAQGSSKANSSASIETTVEMRANAAKEFKEADAQLNLVYYKLLARIGVPNQKANLRVAQGSWLKYRDAHSAFEASLYQGGSIQPQIRIICQTQMTKNRVQELQHILDSDLNN